MKPGRRRKKEKGNTWLVTYSDMVTLILVFFILLFSMSQIDDDKFEMVSESFQSRGIFDFYPSIRPTENPSDAATPTEESEDDIESMAAERDEHKEEEEVTEEEELNSLAEDVESYLVEHDLTELISATRTSEGVELVLQDYIFFDPGEATILEEGIPFLEMVGNLLLNIDNKVMIEGHTDDHPMRSYRYPSNWELSGARASGIVRFLTNTVGIDENRFQIAGYGDTRPLVPNDTAKNMAQNRRVEIIILKEDENLNEESSE
jgi:chemotaxis protein MotB